MSKALFHFTKAAEHLSISKAAKELGISQPAISKSIRSLEKQLNITLISRLSRGISLTPAGEIVYLRAQKIEFEWQAISRDIRSLADEENYLRVGAGPAWQKPVTSILPEFMRRHPTTNLNIRSAPISQLIQPLLNDEIDLALGGENDQELLKNNGLSFTPIVDCHLCVIASKKHPLNSEEIHEVRALSNYSWVAFQSSSEILNHVNSLLEREGGRRVRYILETEFLDMALEVVKRSNALLCISNQLFEQVKDYDLVALNLSESIWQYHLGVWAKPTQVRNPQVNDFLEMLTRKISYRI